MDRTILIQIDVDGELQDKRGKLKSITTKKLREIQKVEDEAEKDEDVLKYFFDNIIQMEETIDFEDVDLLSFATEIQEKFTKKLQMQGN